MSIFAAAGAIITLVAINQPKAATASDEWKLIAVSSPGITQCTQLRAQPVPSIGYDKSLNNRPAGQMKRTKQ
jgi:hypothetical protein